MTPLRLVIVDDEPLALQGLKLRLDAMDSVETLAACANGREAIRAVKELKPDLLMLDIQMPGLDGFDVVRALMGTPEMPLVIFVTAYDRYALEAFDSHALDYLLKPVEESRLEDAIRRARQRLAERHAAAQAARLRRLLDGLDAAADTTALTDALDPDAADPGESYPAQLAIKDGGRVHLVPVEEIDYIDAAGDYMCVHTGETTHIARETMKSMVRRLDPARFQRVHRSTIVNLDRIASVRPHLNGECFLSLKSGKELKVSRSYRSVVARFM